MNSAADSRVGSQDRAAHQQLHLRAAGGVDGVAMPAGRVGVRAGQQKHLLDPRHRRHQRALVGQVADDSLGSRRQSAGGLAGAYQRPDLPARAQQLPDQRGADLAAAADDKDQRPFSFHHPGLVTTCGSAPGQIKGQSLIGSIRIPD